MTLQVTRIQVPPIEGNLNGGYSLGLEYPLIYGYRAERRRWMLWDRHTGRVFAAAPENTEDWLGQSMMKSIAELQTTIAELVNPAVYDSIP